MSVATTARTSGSLSASAARWVDVGVAAVLALVAALVRLPALGPSSLWLDDAWVALVARADGPADVWRVAVTAPGHTVALATWLRTVGFSETAAQLPAFAAGALGPAVAFVVARRLGRSRPAALLAGALLLSAPVHVAMSGRVKPYTLDAVLSLLVVAGAWALVTRIRAARGGDDPAGPATRTWAVAVGAGAVAVMVSAALAPMVAGAVLAVGRATRRSPTLRARWLAATAALGVLLAAWWLAVLRPSIRPGLVAYWAPHFLDTSGPAEFARDLGASLVRLLDGAVAVPWPLTLAVVLVGAGVLAVRDRVALVLLTAPFGVMIVLATLQRAPLGGGRTDTFLFPLVALLVAAAVDVAPRGRPAVATATIVVALAAVVLGFARPPTYPAFDVRPLVAAAESSGAPIVVYPSARWAYALYTTHDVTLVDDPDEATGFDVEIAGVAVLPPHRDDPTAYAAEVSTATAGRDEVVFVVSHPGPDVGAIEAAFRAAGFESVDVERRDGAKSIRYRR